MNINRKHTINEFCSVHPHILHFTLMLLIILGCSGDSWMEKGKDALTADDYPSAVWYLQQAIEERPTNVEAHYQLGVAYYKLRRYDDALNSLRTAAMLAPKRMDIQLALGEVYMAMGQRRLALRKFMTVLEVSGDKKWIQQIARLTGNEYKTTRITPDYVRAYGVSTAAGRIAFTAYVDDNNEIYIMDLSSKQKKRLTFNDTNDYNPALSADGTQVVYVSFMRWRNSNDEIFLIDTEGEKQPKRLTKNVATDGNPNFSPDGTLITFESNRDGNSEIYIMNSDGTNQRRLTHTNTDNHSPAFSFDGKRIVFAAYVVGQHPTGTDVKTRTAVSGASSDAYGVTSHICVINVDGENFMQLTDIAAINANPSFSPDGKQIIFESNRDGDSEIYIMSASSQKPVKADGHELVQLTNNDHIDAEPTFTSDGTKIIFVGQRETSDNLGIYVMDLKQPFTKAEILEQVKRELGIIR